MKNEESEDEAEVGAPALSQHAILLTSTIGNSTHVLLTTNLHEIRNNASCSASPPSSPVDSPSSLPSCSIDKEDKEDFANAILTWTTYSEFSTFCSKIGIYFNNVDEAKQFFDHVREQQNLSTVNLDYNNACPG